MYTIGEFSRIGHVSKKMLRHYDSIGLLVPDEINETNGYRYYSHAQVTRMIKINKLKDYKFSLKEIIEVLKEDDDESYLNAIKNKLNEINDEMKNLKSVISQMKSEVKAMQDGTSMFTKRTFVVVKDTVEEFNYISIRKFVGVAETWEMHEFCYKQTFDNGLKPIGPSYSMYHDDDFNIESSDIEICLPVDNEVAGLTKKQKKLSVIRTEFIGPYTEISEGYAALFDFARENNLEIIRPAHELYIKGPEDNVEPDSYVTEIYFEVKRKDE